MDSFGHAGLRFEVSDDGPADGPVVVLLHGFPADRSCWAGITPALVEAGYRVLAPDQRGYAPGARPRRRRDYVLDRLAGDVLALADRAGAARFDLVGHDWGAALAFFVAARHPARVRSLTAFSVPHGDAWLRSLTRSTQLLRSWYIGLFQLPLLPEWLLHRGQGAGLRRALVRSGLDEEIARRYAARAVRSEDLRGPLNWYRMIPLAARRSTRLPPVAVPTLFVWSDRDRFVTRTAADLCVRSVCGPYRYEVLRGVSHWIPEQEPARAAALLLAHLESADPR